MASGPFESPHELIAHACDQVHDADTRIKSFFTKEPKPYTPVINIDTKTGQQIHKIRLTAKLPGKITVVVKDAAGNFRDALDHAVYAATGCLKGGDPRHTAFPFAKDAAGVDGQLQGGRCADIPPEIRSFLLAFQPYEGGNDLLWGLNSIRNPNTHRMLVPVGTRAQATALSLESVTVRGGSQIGYSKWDAAKNEIEFMRLGSGSTYKYQVNVDFEVAFEGVHALSGKPVISTLHAIASEVDRVVRSIEAETRRLLRERSA